MKTRHALIAWLMLTVASFAYPAWIVIGIRASDLDATTRNKVKTGLQQMLSPGEDWPSDPIPEPRTAVLAANTNVQVKYFVFWTRHLLGKWIGKEACRTNTDAQIDAWWTANSAAITNKIAVITGSVDKASFRFIPTDNWQKTLEDNGVLVPTSDITQ